MLRDDYKPQSIRQSGQHLLKNNGRGKYRLALVTSLLGIAILFFSLAPKQAPASLTNKPSIEHKINVPEVVITRTALALNDKVPEIKITSISTDINKQEFATNNRHSLELSLDKSYFENDTDEDNKPANQLISVIIKSGDNLANIFQKQSIPARELQYILKLGKAVKPLTRIMPGKILYFIKSPENQLIQIRYPLDATTTLTIKRSQDDNSYTSNIDTIQIQTELVSTHGVIKDSLFLSGKKAGLTDNLIMQLAGIFGWDIDFILDIREGDSFNLVYEKRYANGEFLGNGSIVAAEFTNRGKSFRAVRYTDSKGESHFYTPEGLSMRKTFLRAPLDFLYVSSKFNPKRYHPILKRIKAHRGIDYRAATGTPVFAAGDGKVIKSAYDKYNGNHVFIQHGEKYVTKYLHFSKRKVRKGQRVKQGQTIGLVGSTGMSQAPHLHYEFLVNGVHRNSRTVSLPKAKAIAKKEKIAFGEQTKSLVNRLALEERIYASND